MKKVLTGIGIVLIGVCAVGGLALRSMGQAKANAEKNKPTEVAVTTGDIDLFVVDSGTIDAQTAVEVKSQVSGRLAKLLVKEGDMVKKGQLIAIIDPQETRNRVQQDLAQLKGAQSGVRRSSIEISQRRITAQSNLERAKLRVAQLNKELESQPNLTKASIAQAEAAYKTALQRRDQLVKVSQPNDRAAVETGLRDAEANLANVTNELSRRKGLFEKGYISQRELQDAELQLELAKSRLQNAREKMNRLKDQEDLDIKQADEQIKQARADLDRANANRIQDVTKRQDYQSAVASLRDAEAALRDPEAMEQSKVQAQASVEQISNSLRESQRLLGETEIRAPLDGVVSRKYIQEGELVTSIGSFSNGSPIVRIEDRTKMVVKLSINEIDVARLKLGMQAQINVEAIPKETFPGIVSKISPSSQAAAAGTSARDAVVRYDVEVEFKFASDALKSGMTAKCSVAVLKHKGVLVAPLEYVGKDDKGRFVMVAPATAKEKAKRVAVEVGPESGTTIEITSGVKAGTKLVKPPFSGPNRVGAFGDGGGASVTVD